MDRFSYMSECGVHCLCRLGSDCDICQGVVHGVVAQGPRHKICHSRVPPQFEPNAKFCQKSE